MFGRIVTGVVVVIVGLASVSTVRAEQEWLAVCSQCVNPTITSKSGIGTASAVAEAKITKAEVEGWCENWQPGDKSCVEQKLAEEDLSKIYRATADCTVGRITAVDGRTYSLAGVWDNSDIGGGRTKWKDSDGQIVGRDNASGGLGISQQWEVLCPGVSKLAAPKAVTGSAAAAKAKPSEPVAEFSVGQSVLAEYGRDWVPARVTKVRRGDRGGAEVSYEVDLANGKHGIVPARMLRAK